MNRTWKNVELPKADADKLRSFLKRADIKFETSEADNLIHFEAYINDFETEVVNEFLDRL